MSIKLSRFQNMPGWQFFLRLGRVSVAFSRSPGYVGLISLTLRGVCDRGWRVRVFRPCGWMLFVTAKRKGNYGWVELGLNTRVNVET